MLRLGFGRQKHSFVLHKVMSEETKYFYIVATLNSDNPVSVAPLLYSLDSSSRYSDSKYLLLDKFGLSEDKRAQLFFDLIDLGDRQPSEVMDFLIRFHAGKRPRF